MCRTRISCNIISIHFNSRLIAHEKKTKNSILTKTHTYKKISRCLHSNCNFKHAAINISKNILNLLFCEILHLVFWMLLHFFIQLSPYIHCFQRTLLYYILQNRTIISVNGFPHRHIYYPNP